MNLSCNFSARPSYSSGLTHPSPLCHAFEPSYAGKTASLRHLQHVAQTCQIALLTAHTFCANVFTDHSRGERESERPRTGERDLQTARPPSEQDPTRSTRSHCRSSVHIVHTAATFLVSFSDKFPNFDWSPTDLGNFWSANLPK